MLPTILPSCRLMAGWWCRVDGCGWWTGGRPRESAQQASNPVAFRAEDVGYPFIGSGSGATAPRDKRQREGQPCRLGALNLATLHSTLNQVSHDCEGIRACERGVEERERNFDQESVKGEGERQEGVATPNRQFVGLQWTGCLAFLVGAVTRICKQASRTVRVNAATLRDR